MWVGIQTDKGFLCDIPFRGQPYTGKGKELSASKRVTGQSKPYRMPNGRGARYELGNQASEQESQKPMTGSASPCLPLGRSDINSS